MPRVNGSSLRKSSIAATLLLGVSSIIVTLAAPGSAHAAEPRPFYAGKMLTIIVGLPPGGGADAYARLVQRHYPRHIPGRPTIVVQNLPGAGSLQSVMFVTDTATTE